MSLKLSRGKINFLTKLVIDFIEEDEEMDYLGELAQLRLQVFNTIKNELEYFEEMEENARDKIRSIKKNIPEGSQEWQILFRKYCRETMEKSPKNWI